MGKRGPAPKPTALKILEGNKGKRPLNKKEPKPKLGIPKMPQHLGAIARQKWREVVPELDRMGMLALVDAADLEGFCVAYQDAVECDEIIREKGRVITTPTGIARANPAVLQKREAWARVHRFAGEFGLSPASRTRIQVEFGASAQEEGDKDDEYYFNKPRNKQA